MLVPATSREFPQTTRPAKRDAETLAWFGTAYGRRSATFSGSSKVKTPPADIRSSSNAPAAFGRPDRPVTSTLQILVQLAVLGAIFAALLVKQTVNFAKSPSNISSSVIEQPLASSPQSETPGPKIARDEPQRPVLEATDDGGKPDAVKAPADEPATLKEPASSELTVPPSGTTAAALALPLPIPIGPALQPAAVAQPAPVPPLAADVRPDAVDVTQGPIADVRAAAVAATKPASPQLTARSSRDEERSLTHLRNPDLRAGQEHFANGDLAAARAAFSKAMKSGLPEAALGIGNTYDPVTLAKSGLNEKGDPEEARRWYRRAFELAMRRSSRARP